jgi:hypothetical protein
LTEYSYTDGAFSTLKADDNGDGIIDLEMTLSGQVIENVDENDEDNEEEEEEVDEPEIAEPQNNLSQGSRAKQKPQGRVAGASTQSDTARLEKMIFLLQEIIRLTILMKQL